VKSNFWNIWPKLFEQQFHVFYCSSCYFATSSFHFVLKSIVAASELQPLDFQPNFIQHSSCGNFAAGSSIFCHTTKHQFVYFELFFIVIWLHFLFYRFKRGYIEIEILIAFLLKHNKIRFSKIQDLISRTHYYSNTSF